MMLENLLEKSYDVESEAKQRTYLVSYVCSSALLYVDIYRYSDLLQLELLLLQHLYIRVVVLVIRNSSLFGRADFRVTTLAD